MRLKSSINCRGQIYIPKKVRDKISFNAVQVDYVADARAILIIPSNFPDDEAIKSIEIIKKHLKHDFELKTKEEKV